MYYLTTIFFLSQTGGELLKIRFVEAELECYFERFDVLQSG